MPLPTDDPYAPVADLESDPYAGVATDDPYAGVAEAPPAVSDRPRDPTVGRDFTLPEEAPVEYAKQAVRGLVDQGLGGALEGGARMASKLSQEVHGGEYVALESQLRDLDTVEKNEAEAAQRALTRPSEYRGVPGQSPAEVLQRRTAQRADYETKRRAILDRLTAIENASPTGQEANRIAGLRQSVREALPVNRDIQQSIGGQIVQGVGQAAGSLPFYLIPGVGEVLGPATSVAQIYQEGYDDAIHSGATPAEAHETAIGYLPASALDVLGDRLVIGRLLKPLIGRPIGRVISEIAGRALAEGSTEAGQQAYLNLVTKELSKYDPNRELTKEVYDSFVVGTAIGGIASGGIELAQAHHEAQSTLDQTKQQALVGTAQAIQQTAQAEAVHQQATAAKQQATLQQANAAASAVLAVDSIDTLEGMTAVQADLTQQAKAAEATRQQADLAQATAVRSTQQAISSAEQAAQAVPVAEHAADNIALAVAEQSQPSQPGTSPEGLTTTQGVSADELAGAREMTAVPPAEPAAAPSLAPATYVGEQPGLPVEMLPQVVQRMINRGVDPAEAQARAEMLTQPTQLFNLTAEVGGQPVGSTVTGETLTKLGYQLPLPEVIQHAEENRTEAATPSPQAPPVEEANRGVRLRDAAQTGLATPVVENANEGNGPRLESATQTAVGRSVIGQWANRVINDRGLGSGKLLTPDPEILFAYAVKGAELIEQGVRDIGQWTQRMIQQFGEVATPVLAQVRRHAEDLLRRVQSGEAVDPQQEIAALAAQATPKPVRVSLEDERSIEEEAARQNDVEVDSGPAFDQPEVGQTEDFAKEISQAFGTEAGQRVQRAIETQVLGQKMTVDGRQTIGPEDFAKARRVAKRVFDEAGISSTWNGRYFTIDDPNAVTEPQAQALLTAAQKVFDSGETIPQVLANSLRSPDSDVLNLPNVSPGLRNELWAAGQSEASFYGSMLQGFRATRVLSWLVEHADTVLHKLWSDAFGGRRITEITTDAREKVVDETATGATNRLDQTPAGEKVVNALDEAMEKADRLATPPKPRQGSGRKRGAGLRPLVDAILAATPEQQADPKWRSRTIIDYLTRNGLTPEQAALAAQELAAKFDALLKVAKERALREIERRLTPAEKKERGRRSLLDEIARMVNSGVFDAAEALRRIAAARGWSIPTAQEIARMKALSAREKSLRTLSDEERAGKTDAEIAQAERLKAAATLNERANLRSEMQTLWSKFTRPLTIRTHQGRANLNQAGQEYLSSNMLATIGFATKQPVDVLTQLFYHAPTRAIAQAAQQRAADLANDPKAHSRFLADARQALGDAALAIRNNALDGLTAGGQAFVGRGQQRNVEGLLTSIHAFDRLRLYADSLDQRARQMPEGVERATVETAAFVLDFASYLDIGFRIARGLDAIQGTFIEAQEARELRIRALRERGLTPNEARAKVAEIEGDRVAEMALASAYTRQRLDQEGIEVTPQQFRAAAYQVFLQRQRERAAVANLPVDDQTKQAEIVRQTNGWNMPERHGPGVGVAKLTTALGKIFERLNIPLPLARFENAIAIGTNRALTWAGGGFFPSIFGHIDTKTGLSENYWYRTPKDRTQRKLEAATGVVAWPVLAALAAQGILRVYNRGPDDPEERELWQRQGHRAGTVEFKIPGTNRSIVVSLSSGPLSVARIPLAAIGTVQDFAATSARRREQLAREAAKKGAPLGEQPEIATGDLASIAAWGVFNSILSGRTAGGALRSVAPSDSAGIDSFVSNLAASQTGPFIPLQPGFAQLQRARGITPDYRVASFADLIVPLANDLETKRNFLNDEITARKAQLFFQTMTGGTYPLPVENTPDRDLKPYRILGRIPWRPNPISRTQGYVIDGAYRPLTTEEWIKAMRLRGDYLKAKLNELDEYADDAALDEAARRIGTEATQYGLQRGVGSTALTVPQIERENELVDALVR